MAVQHAIAFFAGETAQQGLAPQQFLGEPTVLAAGIGFIVVAALVLYFLKKVVINSILGVLAWAVLNFVLNIHLPFWASLLVSVVFGLAGVGVMLVLRFLGLL